MDKNRELAELLGLCWHENAIQPLYSNIRFACSKCGSMDYNPDFTTDPGKIELLRLMMKREDWWDFCNTIGRAVPGFTTVNCFIDVDLITNTTGLLAQAAREFLRGINKKRSSNREISFTEWQKNGDY
jgi:hypothetical protein